ncbi:MAG: DUF2157 domain-containing protein [Patescibacteria group bacterium]|nr:DUF2157 domain-containing protein [Patescibacteria group bacterium]
MEKQQLLAELRNSISAGEISQAEISGLFAGEVSAGAVPETGSRHASLSQIMYYLGGAIVFLGITILLGQNWQYFGPGVKIFVTLGSAIAAFVVAVLLLGYPSLKGVAQAFFLISGLVLPLGMYITVDKMGFDIQSNTVQPRIWLIVFGAFLAAFLKYKSPVLALFAILYATGAYSFAVDSVVSQNLSYDSKIVEYKILVASVAYMCLGYYLSETAQKALTGFLYGFGVLAFLGSSMALGGWNPNQNAFWELVFPLLVFVVIFLSVYLKSKSFLVFGSLFLVGYIFKLTGEYFQESLGWPLALVIAGFLVMLVGFYAVRLGKRYFPKAV